MTRASQKEEVALPTKKGRNNETGVGAQSHAPSKFQDAPASLAHAHCNGRGA